MKTILLIEDDLDILENLEEFLEIQGYKILSASDGQTDVVLAKQHKPDLIICYVKMPKISGIEVFEILKQELQTR